MYFDTIRLMGGSVVDLPIIGASPSTPYILQEATGLGPPDVDIALLNGVYQARAPQNRTIVLTIKLNPDYSKNQTAESMRTTLYWMLTLQVSKALGILIMDGSDVVGMTEGFVSKFEPVMFSKDPAVALTIECTNPYIRDPSDTSYIPPKVSPLSIVYNGTESTGFRAEIQATSTFGMISLTRDGDDTQFMSIRKQILSGDILRIDTRTGTRDVSVLRNNARISYLPYLTSDSVWMRLFPGNNLFRFDQSNFNWVGLTYRPTYWGV